MILEGYTTLATIILLGLLSERTRNREKVTVRDAALSESIDRLKEQKMISAVLRNKIMSQREQMGDQKAERNAVFSQLVKVTREAGAKGSQAEKLEVQLEQLRKAAKKYVGDGDRIFFELINTKRDIEIKDVQINALEVEVKELKEKLADQQLLTKEEKKLSVERLVLLAEASKEIKALRARDKQIATNVAAGIFLGIPEKDPDRLAANVRLEVLEEKLGEAVRGLDGAITSPQKSRQEATMENLTKWVDEGDV